jgi:pyruvate dehydrogenase E2 component (dihydrolipoamide acetyltransferase)
MITTIVMPDLGAAAQDAILVTWLVDEGDALAVGQPMYEVETDKSLVTAEAAEAGIVERLLVAPGTVVAVGSPIALLRGVEAGPVTLESPMPEACREPVSVRADGAAGHGAEAVPHDPSRARSKLDISPRARRTAERLGVDASALVGTGPGGRIVEQDVLAAAPPAF